MTHIFIFKDEGEESYLDGITSQYSIMAENGRPIAYGFDEEEFKLIAAAPEMLEALEWAIEQLDAEYTKKLAITKHTANRMEHAKQAIEKAKGN